MALGVASAPDTALFQLSQQAPEHTLRAGSEGLVGGEVGPGGAALRRVDALQFGVGHAAGHFVFDAGLQLFEHLVHAGEVFVQRVASAEGNPVDALTKLGHGGEMFRPQIVDGREPHEAFGFRRRRRPAGENVLP